MPLRFSSFLKSQHHRRAVRTTLGHECCGVGADADQFKRLREKRQRLSRVEIPYLCVNVRFETTTSIMHLKIPVPKTCDPSYISPATRTKRQHPRNATVEQDRQHTVIRGENYFRDYYRFGSLFTTWRSIGLDGWAALFTVSDTPGEPICLTW